MCPSQLLRIYARAFRLCVIFLAGNLFGIPSLGAQMLEKITWDLKVGIIKFGDAHMVQTFEPGTKTTQLRAEAEGTGIFKLLYSNKYLFTATMQPKSGLPLQSGYMLRQGSLDVQNSIRYDHHTLPDSTLIVSALTGQKRIHKYSYDILTAFYYFRTSLVSPQMKIGDTLVIKTYFTDEPWDLVIYYRGKTFINSHLGRKECYVFNPVPALGNFFDSDDAITVWISTDARKIPLKMLADIKIASVTATLIDYQTANAP